MADKKKDEEKELLPVEVTITAEHVAGPHAIELRRKEGIVVEARTEDFRSTETVGAKTIENILREAGVELPTGDQELVIKFSPHNGQMISVEAKAG